MNISRTLITLSLMSALMACADSSYHDSNGMYRSGTIKNDDFRHEQHVMAGSPSRVIPLTQASYRQAGYYDRHSKFIAAMDGGPHVEKQYHPPRGMCRLWFVDRIAENQPDVDYCAHVHTTVPARSLCDVWRLTFYPSNSKGYLYA